MEDVHHLYSNDYGIAFKWKRCDIKDLKNVQVIFGCTVLSLTADQLSVLGNNIEFTLNNSLGKAQSNCCMHNDINLLRTPVKEVSLTMNTHELHGLSDLIKGTLFELQMEGLINQLL